MFLGRQIFFPVRKYVISFVIGIINKGLYVHGGIDSWVKITHQSHRNWSLMTNDDSLFIRFIREEKTNNNNDKNNHKKGRKKNQTIQI